jgi:hypothetical protein
MFCKNCGEQLDDLALTCPKCGAATATQTPPPPPQYQQPTYQQPTYQQPTYQQPTYQQPTYQQPPVYQQPAYQQPQYQQQYPQAPVADVPNFGFKLLGFCIPLVGLILYLVWKDQKPITAKAVGKAALIGFIVGIVLSIAYYVIIFLVLGGLGAYHSYSFSSYIANFASRFYIR